MRTPRFSRGLISLVLLAGMLACCTDVPNIDLGSFKLKVAYLVYAVLPIFVWLEAPILPLRLFGFSAGVAAFFLPSLLKSTNVNTSIAFFGGLLSSLLIMVSTAQLVKRLGPRGTMSTYQFFYRAAILTSCVPVVAGWTERAHFTLYEPSYYAIMLIPYFCITFDKAMEKGWGSALFDVFLIVLAVVTSSSASMLSWLILSLAFVALQRRSLTLSNIAAAAVCAALFCAVAVQVSPRASNTYDRFGEALRQPEVTADAVIYIVGNRLQKALVAFEVFRTHPLTGVGMGALKEYAGGTLDVYDFLIDGFSASDFEINSNAANVYLEVGAEAGLPGLAGYFLLLSFLWGLRGRTNISAPFKAGLAVTAVALLIESSYLRSYVWNLYGVVLGLAESPGVCLGRTAWTAAPPTSSGGTRS